MSRLRQGGAALGALLGAPLGLLGLALRPSLAKGLGERLGRDDAPGMPGAIWVHGASVGEVQAALRVVDALREAGEPVLASAMTPTGRALLRSSRPQLASRLAPLDHPWAVDRVLARMRPRLLVFVETELWPAWIRGAARAGVPALVVSGRLSDRSFPRYRKLRFWIRPLLERLAAIGARGERDAERFVALGAPPERVVVTGDLKLEPPSRPAPLPPAVEALLGGVPLVVAGSTHEGEEAAALDALAALEAAGQAAALAIAPRHPERFEAVARAIQARGRRRVRASAAAGEARLAGGDVLLVDAIGWLSALWPHANVAFVGGSLVPRGGHNVLEPAFAGRAVLFGPHVENARDAAEILLAADAARRLPDAAALAAACIEALQDPAAWSARGERAAAALAAHSGALARSLALIERVGKSA